MSRLTAIVSLVVVLCFFPMSHVYGQDVSQNANIAPKRVEGSGFPTITRSDVATFVFAAATGGIGAVVHAAKLAAGYYFADKVIKEIPPVDEARNAIMQGANDAISAAVTPVIGAVMTVPGASAIDSAAFDLFKFMDQPIIGSGNRTDSLTPVASESTASPSDSTGIQEGFSNFDESLRNSQGWTSPSNKEIQNISDGIQPQTSGFKWQDSVINNSQSLESVPWIDSFRGLNNSNPIIAPTNDEITSSFQPAQTASWSGDYLSSLFNNPYYPSSDNTSVGTNFSPTLGTDSSWTYSNGNFENANQPSDSVQTPTSPNQEFLGGDNRDYDWSLY